MRNFLSGPMCPRCLEPLKSWRFGPQPVLCQICKFSIPASYLRDIKKTPPIFVQLIGLTSVGKTTFLDMLRIQLYRITKMWPNSSVMPITEKDLEYRQTLLADRAQGILGDITTPRSRDQNDVYIMQLKRMDRWNSHFLVLMDFSGEQFNKLHIPIDDIPFFCRVPVTIMLLSIPDMQREGKTMEDVLYSYITTLENQRVKVSRRQLIIVFNKADLISDLPQEVKEYLWRDTLYQQLQYEQWVPNMSGKYLSDYIVHMEHISNILGQWILSIEGGSNVWAILRDRRVGVRFCAMSATGHQLTGSNQKPVPRRVFDPFFWIMQYYYDHW